MTARTPFSLGLVATLLAALAGCAELTAPPPAEREPAPVTGNARPKPASNLPKVKPQVIDARRKAALGSPRPAPPGGEAPAQVAASHILISYKGGLRAKPTVTRSKDEAKQEAERIAKLAKTGDFAELAKKHSDGPSGPKGGALGKFGRTQMVKPFSDAAFKLKVGEVSEPVETPFGFHIIKRTE